MISNTSSSLLPLTASTTEVTSSDIKYNPCQIILFKTINNSSIKLFDVILLIPNFLFLVFLVYRLGVAQVQLHKIKCPIVKTVYSMVFLVCIVGIIRCFVSMLLSAIWKEEHKDALPTKILWLLLSTFLLAVELSVIIFGVWAGNMRDSRKGVQKVLLVASICAVAYSSVQAVLEFVNCPGVNGIYGKMTKYDVYGHGGSLFWSSTSLFMAMVYFIIVILPWTKLRECCVIPARRSFYIYCGFLSFINLVQGCASLLLHVRIHESLCILDFTVLVYYTLFGPLVYWTFLKDFFSRSVNFHVLRVESSSGINVYTALPTEDHADYSDEDE